MNKFLTGLLCTFIKSLALFFVITYNASAAISSNENTESDFVIQENEITEWTNEMNKWKNQQLTIPIIDLLKNGQRKQAKLALAKYLTKYPENMQAMEFAGSLLMEDKDYLSAVNAFVRVLKKYPAHNNVRTKLGISLILLGEYNKGEKVLHQVLTQAPKNRLALAYLAWLSQKNGNDNQAKIYLNKLIQDSENKNLNKFHMALARLYFKEHQYKECITLLENLVNNSSEDSFDLFNANILLANSYIHIGQLKNAEEIKNKLNKKHSDEVNFKFLNALLLRENGKFHKALNVYKKIIKDTPVRENDAKQEIASTYSLMNKPDKAIEVLEDVVSSIKIEFVPSIVRDMLAILASNQQYDRAYQITEKYSKRFPDSAEINYLKAEALVLQGKNTEAIAYLKKQIIDHPSFLQNYILASHLASNTSLIDAETFLKSAVKNNPNSTSAWIELANLYFRHDSIIKAESTLEEAVKNNKEDTVLLFELATVKDELNKTPEANSLYRRVIAQNATHVSALHNLLSNLAKTPEGRKEALIIGEFVFSKGVYDPFVLDAYGNVLLKSDNLDKAMTILKTAEEHITPDILTNDNTGVAILYFHLGKVSKLKGDNIESKNYFEKAKKLGLDESYLSEIKKL